jgi:hypothetical protein
MVLWALAISGWLLALVAFVMVRRLASRVSDVTAMHWELKYAHVELKARVAEIDPRPEDAPPPPAPATQFVPLSQVKR